jgi:hypothetical protein
MVSSAGLTLISAKKETDYEDGELISFLWIIAQKGRYKAEKY